MSEDFCLPFGAWTVKMNVEPNGTHPEMAPTATRLLLFRPNVCRKRRAPRPSPTSPSWITPGATSVETSPTPPCTYPFAIFCGIFSSGWREEAEMASKGSEFGLNFLNENGGGRKPGPGRGGGAWSTSGRKWSLPPTTRAGRTRPRARPSIGTGTTVPNTPHQGRRRDLQRQPPRLRTPEGRRVQRVIRRRSS